MSLRALRFVLAFWMVGLTSCIRVAALSETAFLSSEVSSRKVIVNNISERMMTFFPQVLKRLKSFIFKTNHPWIGFHSIPAKYGL
jgi:hypothetical protein